ncbi:OmpA family protein [Brevibacterium samyangense]|uniref:OmpA-like domain-containing protein n=1 Tax=Brevibacterium samyangense TaxID=366888 RepID=A0ABN2T707_9MICO
MTTSSTRAHGSALVVAGAAVCLGALGLGAGVPGGLGASAVHAATETERPNNSGTGDSGNPPEGRQASPEDLVDAVKTYTDDDVRKSVRQFTGDDVAESVEQYTQKDIDSSVRTLDTIETSGTTTTLTLATDILFAPGSWEIEGEGTDAITTLVEDIPQSATVKVHGHTDSTKGSISNQELSENRATAVAEAIATSRPDLTLETEGFAETEPAVQEDPENPETLAANRRVEIIYEG